MPLVTCLCGKRVEAHDADALVRAFFAHTDGEHPQIKVSEVRREALAAAIRRSGGWDGERAPLPADVDVRPLTPALKDDYLAFFDADAFPDNPVWAACYCLSYCLVTPPGIYDERPAAQNRAERAAMIDRGGASGVLAYAGSRVVGWCHAAPRTALPLLDQTPEFATDEPDATGAIVCYVISPRYRGQGLARRLLDGACDMLRARGLRWVDAYPPKAATTSARSYHGRLDMYLDAGFTHVRDAGFYAVVRKAL
ncbi:MAG TPA: GNAT family N-acetyltransferase [Dehalococcoidia bacterium]|nr:GNAT family N-acetyltransferase [Dehalococcoidia bacterium]